MALRTLFTTTKFSFLGLVIVILNLAYYKINNYVITLIFKSFRVKN